MMDALGEALGEAARQFHVLLARRRAYARARKLLHEHLTLEQRVSLKENGYVVVRGNVSGDEYQVWGAFNGINVIRAKDGARFCFYPNAVRGCLPRPDVILGQILVLRHHERWLLRRFGEPCPGGRR